MPVQFSKFILAGLGLALLPLASAQAGTSPEGVWLNDTGRGAIEIKQCGDKLCGHVVWLRDETDVKGCGRQIIGEARKVGGKSWDGGWIYSPEKKRKYDVELTPLESGKLRVKGYAGTKLFSRTMIWTPAPADLKRCGEGATSAEAAKTAPAPATTAATSPEPQAPVIVNAKPDAGRNAPDVATAPKPAPAETAKSETTATPAREEKSGDVAATEKETPATAPAETGAADEELANEDGDEAGSEAGDKIGGLLDRLAELERETGYGLKKSGEGRCRLKVPFATVDIPCDK